MSIIKVPTDLDLYRTVSDGDLEVCFDHINVPCMVGSFKEEEANFTEPVDSISTSQDRFIMRSSSAKLNPIQGKGLSMFGLGVSYHDAAKQIVSIDDIKVKEPLGYSMKIPNDFDPKIFDMKPRLPKNTSPGIDRNVNLSLKRYMCYSVLKSEVEGICTVVNDEGSEALGPTPPMKPPRGHHCISPKPNTNMYCYVSKSFSERRGYDFGTSPDIVMLPSWEPHCFKIIAQAQPRDLEVHFDPDVWNACMVMFLNCHSEEMQIQLSDVLQYFDENDYHLGSPSLDMKVMITMVLADVYNCSTSDEHECVDLFLRMMDKSVAQTENSANMIVYGDSSNFTQPSAVADPIDISTAEVAVMVWQQYMSYNVAYVSTLWLVQSLLQLPGTVVSRKSVRAKFNNINKVLAQEFISLLTSEQDTSNLLINAIDACCGRKLDNVALYSGLCRSSNDIESTDSYKIKCISVHVTAFYTKTTMTKYQNYQCCLRISNCIEYLKLNVWNRNARVMVLCVNAKQGYHINISELLNGVSDLTSDNRSKIQGIIDELCLNYESTIILLTLDAKLHKLSFAQSVKSLRTFNIEFKEGETLWFDVNK